MTARQGLVSRDTLETQITVSINGNIKITNNSIITIIRALLDLKKHHVVKKNVIWVRCSSFWQSKEPNYFFIVHDVGTLPPCGNVYAYYV